MLQQLHQGVPSWFPGLKWGFVSLKCSQGSKCFASVEDQGPEGGHCSGWDFKVEWEQLTVPTEGPHSTLAVCIDSATTLWKPTFVHMTSFAQQDPVLDQVSWQNVHQESLVMMALGGKKLGPRRQTPFSSVHNLRFVCLLRVSPKVGCG